MTYSELFSRKFNFRFFSDSFFHQIFEFENFRIPFYLRMIGWASKIAYEWNGHVEISLEIFSQVKQHSSKNFLPWTYILQKTVVGCPCPELWKTTIGVANCSAHFLSGAHFIGSCFCTFSCRWFGWLQRETSRNLCLPGGTMETCEGRAPMCSYIIYGYVKSIWLTSPTTHA